MSDTHEPHETLHEASGRSSATPSGKQNAGIPIAIVIAAILIAGAIYLSGSRGNTETTTTAGTGAGTAQATPEIVVLPVTEKDHVRGNPNAPILIVEYSDYDCPYCLVFHNTMSRIMDEFGPTGKVAWVYRHFPIAQLHPAAPKISEAAYCVTELGGNDAFWKFTNALNDAREITYGADGSIQRIGNNDMNRISEFAVAGGVDKGKFELCYNSSKYKEQVQKDVQAATRAGARGTPYSIIMVGGEQTPLSGAQPYETVRQIIQNLIAQIDGQPSRGSLEAQ